MLNGNVRLKNGFCYNFVSFINVFALRVQFTCFCTAYANVWIYEFLVDWNGAVQRRKKGIPRYTHTWYLCLWSVEEAYLLQICINANTHMSESELSFTTKTTQTNYVIKHMNSSILSCIHIVHMAWIRTLIWFELKSTGMTGANVYNIITISMLQHYYLWCHLFSWN